MYVLILEASVLLFVPPPPSSIKNSSASTIAAPISVVPSISISAPAILPSGNTGDYEKVTTPDDDIAIASASPAEPILPSFAIAIAPVVVIVVAVNA